MLFVFISDDFLTRGLGIQDFCFRLCMKTKESYGRNQRKSKEVAKNFISSCCDFAA